MTLLCLVLLPTVLSAGCGLAEKRGKKTLFCYSALSGAATLLLALKAFLLPGDALELPLCSGMGLAPTDFGLFYCLLSAVCFFISLLFAVFYFSRHGHSLGRFFSFWLLTEGAVFGVFLSADLFTLFLFFELMGLSSWVWVMQEETEGAKSAADTYLGVSVIGGLALLAGLLLVRTALGTLQISLLAERAEAYGRSGLLTAGAVCMLVGFGAKAGMFPLHIWLPKAHPAAPAPASAVLSGILTKTGVYGVILTLCRVVPHVPEFSVAVMVLGTVTMVVGAALGVFSQDIKRTLACSSVSQIGFILIGVSVSALSGEGSVAMGGTVLHMTNHSLFKLLLFSVAGIIYANTHSLDLNRIRGYGRDKPMLKLLFAVGALGISGVPLFSGYVSKTLLHEGLVELAAESGGVFFTAVEWLFLFSGGLTAAYMLKLFFCVFTGRSPLEKKGPAMPGYVAAILSVPALLTVALGVAAEPLCAAVWSRCADVFPGHFHPHVPNLFSWTCLKGACISLGIGAAVWLGLVRTVIDRRSTDGRRVYRDPLPRWMELERLYRFVLLKLLPRALGAVCAGLSRLPELFSAVPVGLRRVLGFVSDLPDFILVLLRRTLFRENRRHYIPETGTRFTWLLGQALDSLLGRKEGQPSRSDTLGNAYETLRAENRIVIKSLSFSLIAASGGITLTLIYLFVRLIIRH